MVVDMSLLMDELKTHYPDGISVQDYSHPWDDVGYFAFNRHTILIMNGNCSICDDLALYHYPDGSIPFEITTKEGIMSWVDETRFDRHKGEYKEPIVPPLLTWSLDRLTSLDHVLQVLQLVLIPLVQPIQNR